MEARLQEAIANLEGKHFNVVTISMTPEVMYNNVTDTFSGMSMDILAEAAKLGKFTYNVTESPIDGWTTTVAEGLGNGTNQFDLAWGAFFLTAERASYAIPLVPISSRGNVLTQMLATEPFLEHIFRFVRPFSLSLWLSILGVFFLSSLLFWLLENKKRSSLFVKGKNRSTRKKWTALLLSFDLVLGDALAGGDRERFSTRPAKVFRTFWLFFLLIFNASYTAELTAFITAEKLIVTHESVQSIVDSGQKVCVVEGGATDEYLHRNYPGIQTFPVHNTLLDAYQAMSEGKCVAYVVDELNARYEQLQDERLCSLEIGSSYVLTFAVVPYLRPSLTHLVQYLNTVIVTVKEQGYNYDNENGILFSRYAQMDEDMCESVRSAEALSSEDGSLTATSFAGVYMILGGGAVVSVLLAVWQSHRQKGKIQKREAKQRKEAFNFGSAELELESVVKNEGGKEIGNGRKGGEGKRRRTVGPAFLSTPSFHLNPLRMQGGGPERRRQDEKSGTDEGENTEHFPLRSDEVEVDGSLDDPRLSSKAEETLRAFRFNEEQLEALAHFVASITFEGKAEVVREMMEEGERRL